MVSLNSKAVSKTLVNAAKNLEREVTASAANARKVRYQLQPLIFCLCVVYFLKPYYMQPTMSSQLEQLTMSSQLQAASWSG